MNATALGRLSAANGVASGEGGLPGTIDLLSRLGRLPEASSQWCEQALAVSNTAASLNAQACMHECRAARAQDDPTTYQRAVALQQVRGGAGGVGREWEGAREKS